MFESRQAKNSFFESLYKDGIRVAKRRYYLNSKNESQWNYIDLVNNAILAINSHLSTKTFESELHIRCWFFLELRAQAAKLRKHYSKYTSLNAVVGDSGSTLEDFIASRIVYPSLEDEDLKGAIADAMKVLSPEQQDFVYQAWVQGRAIGDIKGNDKYIKRSLDKAKLKMARKLMRQQH
jgi:DNA-directed RNA polymerase specialized sigma24 family protein